nr:PREDICTED: hepatic lectin-like isoform X2 [Latimeria chalumnae]|eukprot:XP_014345904.1 PREDICTED: hepatic lectin-like isoform X2 [Latimeria chalumnae]
MSPEDHSFMQDLQMQQNMKEVENSLKKVKEKVNAKTSSWKELTTLRTRPSPTIDIDESADKCEDLKELEESVSNISFFLSNFNTSLQSDLQAAQERSSELMNQNLKVIQESIGQMKLSFTSLNTSLHFELQALTKFHSIHSQTLEKVLNLLTAINNTLPDQLHTVTTEKSQMCPSGWQQLVGSCYSFSDERDNWEKANQTCLLKDSHLIVINSEEEQEYFFKHVNKDYWLGLTDLSQEGQFEWVDGTPYNAAITTWGYGQPDNTDNLEHCVHISALMEYYWNDHQCTVLMHWICERDLV